MKRLLFSLLTALTLGAFISCQFNTQTSTQNGNSGSGTNPGTGGTSTPDTPKTDVAPLNPEPYDSRSENLDFIFNPDVLGETTITISRKEWQKMLFFYDSNSENEQYVTARKYNFSKDGKTWELNNVGLRVRGNRSRRRPQYEGYEGYQNNYVQSHFKVDFEEFLEDDKTQSQKIAGCMKGVLLKHFKGDPTYTREVYGYNLFRQNGIWTSPRAAYTKLTIIIEDSESKSETVNYGVYAMIESIDKQFLKARKTKAGGTSGEKFDSDEGNLWKCTNGAPLIPNYGSIGIETGGDFSNVNTTSSDPTNWSATYNGKFTPNYDLKTNKKKVSDAKTQLSTFMSELSSLSGEAKITSWFESKMDVDLFLRTYAINVILGMWDDYWYNQNNYYFYFDTNGQAYFIPYDYDNILGCNLNFDSGTKNPLSWGELNDSRPLMNKLLSVSKYNKLYQKYLLEYSKEGSKFYVTESQKRLNSWKTMVEQHIASSQIEWISESYGEWGDYFAGWGSNFTQYKLFSGDETNNFFMAKTKTIEKCISDDTGDENDTGEVEQDDDSEEIVNWELSGLMPVYVNENDYTFIFVPHDFGVDYDGSQTVVVRGSFNTWSDSATPLTWNSTEKYYETTLTIEDFGENPRYKFFSPTTGKWFGGAEFRGELSENYADSSGNQNLLFPNIDYSTLKNN